MRTVGDYLHVILALLPGGRIWPRDPDSTLHAVASGLAPTAQQVDAAGLALVVDAFPATAFHLLPEWEASLGLPDPCLGPAPTVQERRAQVVARLVAQGGQSAPHIVAFAAALGVTVTVTEFAPTRAGRMRCGDHLADARWAHAWRINAPTTEIVSFRAGVSVVGERLRSWGSYVLECEMRRVAPAHTLLTVAYAGSPEGAPLGLFVLAHHSLTA